MRPLIVYPPVMTTVVLWRWPAISGPDLGRWTAANAARAAAAAAWLAEAGEGRG